MPQGRQGLSFPQCNTPVLLIEVFLALQRETGGVIGGGLSAKDGVQTPRSKSRCSSSAVAVFLRKTTLPLDGPSLSRNDGTF